MPSMANDTAAFDPVDYYTKQLPLDLARLTELRDELSKRQGAMIAVDDALKDREAAAAELAEAKEQATSLIADAKVAEAKSKAKAADLDARAKGLDRIEADARAVLVLRETAVAGRERDVDAREYAAAAKEQALADAADKLAVERAAFNAKVASFQDMVTRMRG